MVLKRPTFYKVTTRKGYAPHLPSEVPIYKWSLPSGGKPGDWHEVKGDIRTCSNGLHLTTDPMRWLKPGYRIFVAEHSGMVGQARDDKQAFQKVRLVREVSVLDLFPGVELLYGDPANAVVECQQLGHQFFLKGPGLESALGCAGFREPGFVIGGFYGSGNSSNEGWEL